MAEDDIKTDRHTGASDPLPLNDADTKTKADQAEADAREADQKALDAKAEADNAEKSDAQRDADRAAAEADDARAHADQVKAEEAADAEVKEGPSTVADAKVLAPVHHETDAGHHRAQKFGNDPANPKAAHGRHEDPDQMTVKLTRTTPDVPEGPVTTMVHPEMVGDYLRAGWSVAA